MINFRISYFRNSSGLRKFFDYENFQNYGICLPGTFDRLKRVEKTSIVVIISPLVALMKDQVALYSSNGTSAAYISQETEYEMARGVTEGRYQLVYFSPKSLLCSQKWGETLTGKPYASSLVAFVLHPRHRDETCLKTAHL